MSDLPNNEEELIRTISTGGSTPSSEPPRQAARAKLDSILIGKLTCCLQQLTAELTIARDEMRHASDKASRHTRALVRVTWVLAALTGVLAVATVAMLFK